MLNKTKLAIILMSAGVVAGLVIASFPARTVLSKDNPTVNGRKVGIVAIAAVAEAPEIEQPMMAITPSPLFGPGAGSHIGAGDGSAGVWEARNPAN